MAASEKAVPQLAESYWRQMCEHMGVALISTDCDLTIMTWNAAAARMFGAGADRMIGTPIESVVPQESRDTADRMLRRSIETGQTFQFEFQHRDETGANRELTGTIAPVVSEDGECLGASLCIRDITRRIQLQTQLAESRKMASLGSVAGAIAHHFNNILGGIMTSVDFALTSQDTSITSRVLRHTATALQRAKVLVHGLLAFSQGEPQASDLSDFTEIVNGILEHVPEMIGDRDIKSHFDIPALPVMPFERVRVHTVLHNIVQNAIEAMPEGGTLTIEAALVSDKVVTRVHDTGIGLDETAKSRIFEPFWSTKDALTTGAESAEGIGLGLAIAHGLVQTVGGTITVRSELDKGSTFEITLPRPRSE